MRKRGLTLMELVIVLAILSILAAILIPSFSSFINRANEAADLAEAHLLYSAAAIHIAVSETVSEGTFSADGAGKTPGMFEEYIGEIWPIPRKAGSKYFEVKILKILNQPPEIDIYRVLTDRTEIYNKSNNVFEPVIS